MRRMLSALVLAALAVVLFGGVAQAQVPTEKQLPWRSSKVSTLGYIDSLTASINGAVQTSDTLVWQSTSDWHWGAHSNSTGLPYGVARLMFSSPLAVNVDSLHVRFEFSRDNGATVQRNSTNVGFAGAAGVGNTYISGPIVVDSDLAGTGSGGAFLQPYWRAIVTADGNTAAFFQAATVHVKYFRKGVF